MGRLEGKSCIVTGGANGIGAATVRAFLREGASVMCTDVDEQSGAALLDELQGAQLRFMRHDVVDPNNWQAVIDTVLVEQGKLDVLVNNAGGGPPGDFETMSLENWRKTISLNLDSTFLGTQLAIRVMKEKGGAIVNLGSHYSFVGMGALPAYSTGKGGVLILTKSAALYCAEKGYKIRVNSVHPGMTKTRTAMAVLTEESGMEIDDAVKMVGQAYPMGRIGEPDEIANAILFLASDEASFATGSALTIDGGFTAQ